MAKKTKKQTSLALTAERQPTPTERGDIVPLADPFTPVQATGEVRRAVDAGYSLDYSPARVLLILRGVQSGQNLQEFVRLAMTVLRRNIKLRSAMSNRVLTVSSLKRVIESGGTSRKARKAAEDCQALVAMPAFKRLVRHLAWASYFGWGGAQIVYAKGVQSWPVTGFKLMQPEWFVFDPTDGETPLLLPKDPGGMPTTLEPYGKFVFHTPQLLPGVPWMNGIAYTAVFYAVLLHIVLKQGTQFIELYNQSMRVGKYVPNETPQGKKDREVLKKALQNLGSDAWAMIPQDMQIEFVKDATAAASVESYERWARYFDELLVQLVQGSSLASGTSNTGGGGSLALGQVHEDAFMRVVQADADEIADTIARDVFTPFVRFNHGEGVEVPYFRLHIEKPEDSEAKMRATKIYWEMGGTVSADELRDYLGWREPEADEATLSQASVAQPSTAVLPDADGGEGAEALTAARFSSEAETDDGDELDHLISELEANADYMRADKAQDEALLSIITATPPEKLVEALVAHIKSHDTTAYAEAIAGALLAANAAGDLGADVGGK